MRLGAAFVIVLAAATAFADDDPDLPVLTGRIADDAPGDVRLTLTRRVMRWPGQWTPTNFHRELTVAPGGTFRFAGLPPCPYELVVEGDGVAREARVLDVYTDVAGVEVRPVRAVAPEVAFISGKFTLSFDGAMTDCVVTATVAGREASAIPAADGSFLLDGLRAGDGWIRFAFERDRGRWKSREKRIHYVRSIPCALHRGENRVVLQLFPDEDVRLVVRPQKSGETIDGLLTILDDAPNGPWSEQIRVVAKGDEELVAYRWVSGGIDDCTFERFGSDFEIGGMSRGWHEIRVEAAGYSTSTVRFEADGPTRPQLVLDPIAGEYVQPKIDADFWLVEERGSLDDWEPVFEWDRRVTRGGEGPAPKPWIFLRPGVHVLRAVKSGAPPSAPVEVSAGGDRKRRVLGFDFPKGASLKGWLSTPQSAKDTQVLGGFEVHVFRLVEKRWEPLRAQQTRCEDAFVIDGLAPGRHRLAFDAAGRHVFAEFDMGDEDTEREFTFRCR